MAHTGNLIRNGSHLTRVDHPRKTTRETICEVIYAVFALDADDRVVRVMGFG
jgi:hypothetical protein